MKVVALALCQIFLSTILFAQSTCHYVPSDGTYVSDDKVVSFVFKGDKVLCNGSDRYKIRIVEQDAGCYITINNPCDTILGLEAGKIHLEHSIVYRFNDSRKKRKDEKYYDCDCYFDTKTGQRYRLKN